MYSFAGINSMVFTGSVGFVCCFFFFPPIFYPRKFSGYFYTFDNFILLLPFYLPIEILHVIPLLMLLLTF